MPASAPNIRRPAVAGRFYPSQPADLGGRVEAYLRQAQVPAGPVPKAIIAPHAGYVFSGPIAASAHAQFAPARETVKRVVLLGPSHHMVFEGLATTSADAFATPLGNVPVDRGAIREICSRLSQVAVLDAAHANEHSLEVHLPFLQVVLADFEIVPLLAGDASDEEVAEVLEALWGGDETRLVISSDLSHYQDYASARELDFATARAIEALRPQDIGVEQACGRTPIRGLLRAAHRRGLHGRTLDLRNSGDTSGPRSEVVGYGAWAFGAAT